jgi:hypothetical protein
LFKARTVVDSTQKGIGVVASPRFVEDLEVEPGEKCGPSCLSAVEGLGFGKVNEVLMVAEYVYLVVGSFEVMSPGFEHSENG